jgi:hypothetical protein
MPYLFEFTAGDSTGAERTFLADYYILFYIKRLSSVQQEVFTHRHDRHQTSVSLLYSILLYCVGPVRCAAERIGTAGRALGRAARRRLSDSRRVCNVL